MDMPERPADERTFEQKVADSPIHGWANIADWMDRAFVPEDVRPHLHELLFLRGDYPPTASKEQAKEFARRASEYVALSPLTPAEAHAARILFGDLVGQWIMSERGKS